MAESLTKILEYKWNHLKSFNEVWLSCNKLFCWIRKLELLRLLWLLLLDKGSTNVPKTYFESSKFCFQSDYLPFWLKKAILKNSVWSRFLSVRKYNKICKILDPVDFILRTNLQVFTTGKCCIIANLSLGDTTS
jgi:hypothetical protein